MPPPPTRNPDIHFQRINGGRSRPQPQPQPLIHSPVPHALPTHFSPLTFDDSSYTPSPPYLPGYRAYPAPGHALQNAPWGNPCPVQLARTLSRQQGLGLGLGILPPRSVPTIEAPYQGSPCEVDPVYVPSPPPPAPIPVPPPVSSMGRSGSRNDTVRVQRGPWHPLNVPGQGRQLTPIMGSPYSGMDRRMHSPAGAQSESSGDTLYESMDDDDDDKFDGLDLLSKSSLFCIGVV